MIYAIDFDGTLCTDEYPKIGAPRYEVIAFARAAKRAGDRLILWTCREGKELAAAVEWCSKLGLTFDAVNDNLSDNISRHGNNCRKVYADQYIDDRSLEIDLLDYMKAFLYGDVEFSEARGLKEGSPLETG